MHGDRHKKEDLDQEAFIILTLEQISLELKMQCVRYLNFAENLQCSFLEYRHCQEMVEKCCLALF